MDRQKNKEQAEKSTNLEGAVSLCKDTIKTEGNLLYKDWLPQCYWVIGGAEEPRESVRQTEMEEEEIHM